MVWDFTFASSHVTSTSKQPGTAAEKAEKVKLGKYKSLLKDYYMVPFAVETLGAVGQEGADLVNFLGKSIQAKTGEKRSSFYLFQSISMAVQRGNAPSILGTVKTGEQLEEIYYL